MARRANLESGRVTLRLETDDVVRLRMLLEKEHKMRTFGWRQATVALVVAHAIKCRHARLFNRADVGARSKTSSELVIKRDGHTLVRLDRNARRRLAAVLGDKAVNP